MEVLPRVFSSGWTSVVNAYPDVLVVAAVLLLVDVIADKIPYLDSGWDALHPLTAAVIAAVLLLVGLSLVAVLWTTIRKGVRRARRRRAEQASPP